MSPKQRVQSNRPTSVGRAVVLASALGIVAVLLGLAAVGIALTRGGTSNDCQAIAWNAVPDPNLLPAGWSMVSNRVFVDSLTTTVVGPVPSSSTQRPAVYVSLSCYGKDASTSLRRAHEGALAAGATDASPPGVGDESLALSNADSGTLTVYVRRGDLVAELTAPASLDQSVITAMAQAVDAAMVHAVAVGPTGAPFLQPSRAPVTQAPTPEPESHVVPDLEALLPQTVGATALTRQSFLGSTVLGTNEASKSLVASLQKLGKTPADLDYAVAYDPTGQSETHLFAYRVKGVAPADLASAIVQSQMANPAEEPLSSTATIGGHPVTKITYGSGTKVYIVGINDVVYAVGIKDEDLASTVIGQLR